MTGPRPEPAKTFPDNGMDAAIKLAGPAPSFMDVKARQEWIRKVQTLYQLITTTRASDSLPKYLASPMMDTLTSVMGKPEEYGLKLDPNSTTLGVHKTVGKVARNRQRIDLNPKLFAQDTIPDKEKGGIGRATTAEKDQLDFVNAHEHGHQFDASFDASFLTSNFWRTFYPNEGSRPTYKVKYRKPEDAYSHNSASEHFAQAAANAFDFLRKTRELDLGNNPKTTEIIKAFVDQRERDIPGTLMIVNYFLRQPIYKDHPLRKAVEEIFKEYYIPNRGKKAIVYSPEDSTNP